MQVEAISRRGFLKCAAGAVGIPYVITTDALGSAGKPAASERLVMGCIGMGGQGTAGMGWRSAGPGVPNTSWVPKGGFMARGVHVAAVCDVNKNNLTRAKGIVDQEYGNNDCTAYKYYQELLAREDIDIVICATGDRWHTPVSIAAAKAGKDVYCEKPISLTVYEARELARAFRRYGRIFQTGTQQRSAREFRFACELVQNGYIGELKHVTVNVGGGPSECNLPAGGDPPDWLDYDIWLGQAPWRPFHPGLLGWMAWRDYSGGEMTNWGAHHYDIAQWATGFETSGPVEIIPPDGKEYKVLTYRYPNGVVMTRNNTCNGVKFEGTKGWVEVNRGYLQTQPESLLRQKIGPDEIHLHVSNDHHLDFLSAVRSRTRPASDADIGYRSISVCHLGNIAYWLKRPLRWDPAGEKFVNDPEADRMLWREMRSPYTI
jgi:predicted dehydrogenase